MNIKEVLSLPENTLVEWKSYHERYRVIIPKDIDGTKSETCLKIEKPTEEEEELDMFLIEHKHSLLDILNADFEVIDERPRYYFFDVLHLDQESPLGVKVIIKEAILHCGHTVDIKKYLDEIDKPLSINRALTIFADLFFNDALTDILLNNGNFIVEENE